MPSAELTTPEHRPFKVLIVGGSYAGLAASLNLLDLCQGRRHRFCIDPEDQGPGRKISVEITIVDERDGYYHLIGVPLALPDYKYADKIWQKFDDIPALQTPEINWIQGSVSAIDTETKVATIEKSGHGIQKTAQQEYDYMIACSGLKRDWPSAPKSLTKKEYLNEAAECVKAIQNAEQGVVVIGGGAVGIEIAAEIKMVQPDTKVTLIHSRQQLLSSEDLPDEFSAKTLELLQSNVEVILGSRVQETVPSPSSGYTLTLSDGRTLQAGYVINAVSRFSATSTYIPTAARDSEGYVTITPELEFASDIPNAKNHYAAGDIIRWSGIKRGGAAMHQGHYAAYNIHQKMFAEVYGTTPKFSSLTEVAPMMALALGDQAVGYFPGTGLTSGDEVRKMFFNDDLGYMICWNWMRLGEAPAK